MDPYSGSYEIRWSDLDANNHVNYSVYIDAAGDLRYRFFIEHGFPPERFTQLGIGPVYTALQARFLREVRMGETITITYSLPAFPRVAPSGKSITMFSNQTGSKPSALTLKGPYSIYPPVGRSLQHPNYWRLST